MKTILVVVFVFVSVVAASPSRLTQVVKDQSSLGGHHERTHMTEDWLIGLDIATDAEAFVSNIAGQLTTGKLELKRVVKHSDHAIAVVDASDVGVQHDALAAVLLSEHQRPDSPMKWFHRDGMSQRRHHH